MLNYLLGVVSALAIYVCIWIIRRKGRSDDIGIKDSIERERLFKERIIHLEKQLQQSRSEILGARQEIQDIRTRFAQVDDRIKSTDGIIADIKERNKL